MLCTLPLVILAAFDAPDEAQNWTRQSPIPTDQSLYTVSFLSPDHGWIGGTDGVWMETQDGGESWAQAPAIPRSPLFQENPFYESFFLDALHGWVIGNNNDAFRTVDGGASWTRMTTFPAGSYDQLDFVDPLHGWAGGNGTIASTDDGGVTWTVLTVYTQYGHATGLDFRDPLVGVFTSSPIVSGSQPAGLYRTADAGATWTLLRAGSFGRVRWVGPNSLLMIGSGGLEFSNDGGTTWQIQPLPFSLSSWTAVGATGIAAIAQDGSIWSSPDLGTTWQQVHPPITFLVGAWSDVQFLDPLTGFVVGRDGFVARSVDGGQTWEPLGSGIGTSTWNEISMATPLDGVAVGNEGAVIVTHDGGRHWRPGMTDAAGAAIGAFLDFEGCDALTPNLLLTAGEDEVFRTTDGGASWQSIRGDLPSGIEISDVDFVDPQTGWVSCTTAFGSTSSIYGTTDGGATWVDLDPQGIVTPNVYAIEFRDAMNGWLAGAGAPVWRTTDGGQSWMPLSTPSSVTSTRSSISFAPDDPDTGWVTGSFGYLAKTDDGGITWNLKTLPNMPSNETPSEVAVLDAQHAWVATRPDGWVYSTVDGGTTWTQIAPTPYVYPGLAFSAIEVTDTGHLWVAGLYGGIWCESPPPLDGVFLHRADLHRGQPMEFRISNGVPGETIFLGYSLVGTGPGPAPAVLGGLQLDLMPPVTLLATPVVPPSGLTTVQLTVPATAPLQYVHFQAAAARGAGGTESVISNTQSLEILP